MEEARARPGVDVATWDGVDGQAPESLFQPVVTGEAPCSVEGGSEEGKGGRHRCSGRRGEGKTDVGRMASGAG